MDKSERYNRSSLLYGQVLCSPDGQVFTLVCYTGARFNRCENSIIDCEKQEGHALVGLAWVGIGYLSDCLV